MITDVTTSLWHRLYFFVTEKYILLDLPVSKLKRFNETVGLVIEQESTSLPSYDGKSFTNTFRYSLKTMYYLLSKKNSFTPKGKNLFRKEVYRIVTFNSTSFVISHQFWFSLTNRIKLVKVTSWIFTSQIVIRLRINYSLF